MSDSPTSDGGARRGTRDNGLRCGNYLAVADLDPRVAGSLLDTLRDNGIAAYVMPMPGSVGGSMETKVPAVQLDRLYVDDQRVDEARRLVDEEVAHSSDGTQPSPDFEQSWQQVLASLQSTPTLMTTPWPERENLTAEEHEAAVDAQLATTFGEDEHYVPPPAPPLPKLRPATWAALLTMALCIAVMVTDVGGGLLDVVAFVVFVAAAASLVYNMRQGPPDDTDWDDGAVV